MTESEATTRILRPSPDTEVTVLDAGSGRAVLVLHGGGGPATVAGIAAHFAEGGRSLLPTHPGWNGTPRAAHLAEAADYAKLYLDLLEAEDLRDVLVIGSSLGGWIGAELVALDDARPGGAARISGLVIIDGVGIEVPGEPVVDFFSLTPREVAEHSWHDSERFFVDPATFPAERVQIQRANMGTMRSIVGDTAMSDPRLAGKLAGVSTPTLVVWGDSDRVATPAYGRGFAAAFENARFEVVAEAGHLPQLEQPAATLALVDGFAAQVG
jgi:pimeloyl-ACP methyl ester carboxylesterase